MKYILIIETETGLIEKTFDVTGKSERQIERISNGMSINLNHKKYHISIDDDEQQ